MTRSLDADFVSALDQPVIFPFFAVQLNFDGEQVRMWTGLNDLTIDGLQYTGAGNFIAFSAMNETSEIAAQGATVTLNGVPSDLLSLALGTAYQGRLCRIFFGVLEGQDFYALQEDNDALLQEDNSKLDLDLRTNEQDVISEVFTGFIDQMIIDEGADTSTITMAIESRLIDLERPRTFRYTSETQNRSTRFPNDLGLEYVEDLQDKRFAWGRK
jgi:hypothetical protein